jgi:hypothetical protein
MRNTTMKYTRQPTPRRHLLATGLLTISLLGTMSTASAEQWYFYVKNDSSQAITGLLTSEDGSKWGRFNLGAGIGSGKKVKLVWNSSTNDQDCKQYVKAVFADGSEFKTTKIDFCEDLDEPIVFSD